MGSNEQKVGEILFEMIEIAMRERGIKMDFVSWDKVDGKGRDNYLEYVKRIMEVLEPPLYVSAKDKLNSH